jgi:cell wall-associated NlpC family hydrolase
MRPRPTLTAAAVAAAMTASVVVALSPGAAAVRPDHLVVLAGSPHFVAYGDFPVPHNGKPDYTHGELHVYNAKGRDRDLGGGFGNADPASPTRYRFSIVGKMLTGYSTADPSHVEWWDLNANSHGIGTLPSGARWQGSAPDGWVIVASDHETVAVQTPAGQITSYGQPLPQEVAAAGNVATLSGPSGVVTFGATSGTAAYQQWTAPSAETPLDLGDAAGAPGLSCADVTGTTVGCTNRADSGVTHLAVPLDGSTPHSFAGCDADSVAVKSKLVWVCDAKTATPRFAGGHHVAKSRVQTAGLTGVSALGAFVTVGPRQRALIAVRSSVAPVRVLVAIPSPIIKLDDAALRAAARDIAAQAVKSGALDTPPTDKYPAQVLQTAADALIRKALAAHPSGRPFNTRSIMGPVPRPLTHPVRHAPHHHRVRATQSLRPFSHAIPDSGSAGLGTHATHGGATPAPFRAPDGVYVEPRLAAPADPTVSMVAIRAALAKVGLPYVWAAAGPSTFDCSGLVQWAYAHAGRPFTHFSGAQWNEARRIRPRDILPGDLVLFSHPIGGRQVIHHVGIYLGAGWMVNAPYTGQYVDLVKVPYGVAGVVRP